METYLRAGLLRSLRLLVRDEEFSVRFYHDSVEILLANGTFDVVDGTCSEDLDEALMCEIRLSVIRPHRRRFLWLLERWWADMALMPQNGQNSLSSSRIRNAYDEIRDQTIGGPIVDLLMRVQDL